MNKPGGYTRLLAALLLASSPLAVPTLGAVGGGGFAMPGAPPQPAPAAPPAAPGAGRTSSGTITPLGAGPATIRLTFTMNDGTRFGGTPAESGPIFDSALGQVQPTWRDVAFLELSDAPGGDQLRLRNGDQARGDLRSTLIGVTSVLGRARVSTTKIRRVDVGSGAIAPAVRKGLLLYYSFDQEEREQITDQSGRENHARMIGGARFVRPGKVGGAYEFTGANRIEHADFYQRHFTRRRQGTFAFWLMPKESGHSEQFVLANSGVSEHFGLTREGGIRWEHGHLDMSTRPGVCQAGDWHHIAGVLDLDGESTLYLDGKPVARGRLGPISLGGALDLQIGAVERMPSASSFRGWVDEVRIYEVALGEQDIRDLATIRAPTASPTAAGPLTLAAELADQTRVRGTAAWTVLPLRGTIFGDLELPWSRVVEVTNHAMAGAEVTLDSGDTFRGTLGFQKATLDSSLGRVTLTTENLKSLRVLRD